MDPGLRARFSAATRDLLGAAATWRGGAGVWAELYLGGGLGARGLASLYQGAYLAAYRDGKSAKLHLERALALEPDFEPAWLGVGQYEYYCGRMAGLLRLVLNLHGDVERAVEVLRRCGEGPSFAALTARVTLARIFAVELHRPREAVPYVVELRRRYPLNHWYVAYALACARDLGADDTEARALADGVALQWRQGWRPPDYAARGLGEEKEFLATLRRFDEGL